MSRGPGRIQRAIEQTFRDNPDEAFTVDWLVGEAYPDLPDDEPIQKKHRVAVLRAARKVAAAAGWCWCNRYGPDRPMVEFNPYNHRSYARAAWRISRYGRYDPENPDIRSRTEPGGEWWLELEINRARRDGDEVALRSLQAMRAEQVADFARMLRRFGFGVPSDVRAKLKTA